MFNRYAAAALAGTVITLALLYAMHALIQLRLSEPAPPDRLPRWLAKVTIVSPPKPVDPPIDFHELTAPVQLPPSLPVESRSRERVSLVPTRPALPVIAKPTGFPDPGNSDSPLVGVMFVQPTYPAIAVTRELEGWVVVQFDVRPDGSVENATVVDSSHTLFEKPAIAAAERSRFKARVVAGVPLPTQGLRKRFVFEMERG